MDSNTAEEQVKGSAWLDPGLDLKTLDLIAAASSGDFDAFDAQKAELHSQDTRCSRRQRRSTDVAFVTLANEIVQADSE